MKKAAPKKKAPVQLTAGTGFRNENCIGARFLLDLLAGTNTLGVDFGKIDRLQWQGRDLGWLADDLIVEGTASTGKRSAGISIKSDRQVTSSGFPPDFVGTAWAQWFGVKTERVLRGSDDAVVLSIERYSPRARRLVHRGMQALLAKEGLTHVHLLVTGQIEPAPKLIRSFIEAGLPATLHSATSLDLPSDDEVQGLVAPIAELQWASLRPELRPLLTNLKILDWLVAAARSGMAINPASIIGVSHLVDALWERWIEGDTDQLSRSHLLMRLGTLEGDTLLASVQRMQLSQNEQAALGSLTASDLVRIRDQRVRFTHDMLGDWARLNILIGEPDLSAPCRRAGRASTSTNWQAR